MKPSMLTKLCFIESDAVPKENTKVEALSTSIKKISMNLLTLLKQNDG